MLEPAVAQRVQALVIMIQCQLDFMFQDKQVDPAMKRLMSAEWIGDRSFYKIIVRIALPIMPQQSNAMLMGFTDSVMVGQLDERFMAGVTIASKLLLNSH